MKTQEPCYDLIRSLKKFGFIDPEDKGWQQINLETSEKKFLKHLCTCANISKEVILKNFSFSQKRNISYFIGQCPRCERIYWTTTDD